MFTMLIRSVRGNRQEYRRQKAATTLRKPVIDDGVAAFAAKDDPPEPDLLSRDEWPRLDGHKLAHITARSECFINEVNKESPPLDGEAVLSDFVTILKSEYLGQPAGTAVLKRITDKADLYYLSSYATVNLDGAITLREPPRLEEAYLPCVGIGESIAATLLLQLAKGLAGEIGKGLGAQLLSAIFPQGSQIDYKALLDDLARIVKEANTEQTVNEQGGKINGIINDVNGYYLERKQKASKDELYSYLLARHSSLYESLGILQQAQFTKKGIASFVSGANINFTLYQEMALEDPQVRDPQQSSNIESLKKAAGDAVTYVNNTVATIITDTVNARTSKISEPYDDAWCDVNVCKSRWYYYDSETSKRYGPYEQCGKDDDPEARCKKARDTFFDSVKSGKTAEITGQLQWMLDCATQWRKLLERPLGSA